MVELGQIGHLRAEACCPQLLVAFLLPEQHLAETGARAPDDARGAVHLYIDALEGDEDVLEGQFLAPFGLSPVISSTSALEKSVLPRS